MLNLFSTPNKISSSKLFASSTSVSSSSSNSITPNGNDDFFALLLDFTLVLAASLAISMTLFVSDVGPASAFVVTMPRKMQTDELATYRLFKDNTPFIVYITNLAVRRIKIYRRAEEEGERLNQDITYEQNTTDDNALAVVTVENLGKRFLISVFSERSFPGLLVSMLEVFEELDLNVLEARASYTNTFHPEAVGRER